MEDRLKACREALGARIGELRKAQGLSLRKFALMVGVDYTYLHAVEHAESSPTVDTLVRIADGLGVAVSDLVEF